MLGGTAKLPRHPVRNRRGCDPGQARGGYLLWVALEGGRVIGSIVAGYDGHRGWLYAVAAELAHRRGGLGTALVRHAERALKALGCVKVNLQLRSTDTGLVRFYERLGYGVEERIGMGRTI